ncbi:MAG: molybdopterin-dependent oxidoreductase, partial [Anaerolineales bacterium]|nr:molybdopterin-dependent oxidoreductase [Anaerolineales bacterium]
MNLTINGASIEIEPLPGETLAHLLRERLGLTGTKIGCEEAECGTCTVLLDDEPVLSCIYPAARAAGKRLLTIEGLAALAEHPGAQPADEARQPLHPLQAAFIEHGAVQCGFCIPGQIMTAHALLQREPNPSEEDIRHALKDTLCRCGGYPAISRAVQAAAARMRGEPHLAPPVVAATPDPGAAAASPQPLRAVGGVHPRPDAVGKATGAAKFSDDLQFEGMLHARVKRAGVPHAILKRLDVSKAARLPGVVAVLTAEQLPGERMHGLVIPDWPVLVGVGERIRTVGDALALVAAQTREIATQALDLIEVEVEPLEVISDPRRAREPDAPAIHPGGNLLKHIKVRKGDISAGFDQAEVILEHTFHTAITDHAFLETECSIACPLPDGRMEVYVGSQIPYADRNQVARALGWPEQRVRIIGQLMGGGFGGKEDIAGQIHAALLAQAARQPVKLLFDRQESLLVHPKRHATQIRVKMGARRDGRLTAVETELYGDTGAYASLGEKVLTRA